MKCLPALVVLLALPLSSAFAAAKVDGATYERLLAELKSGHTDIDYTAFRNAYAASPKYDPYGTTPGADELMTAMKAEDCKKVVAAADKVLANDYTDIQAHVFAASCADHLNEAAAAKFHRAIAVGLLRSIAGSGQGTSLKSPFVVIAVKEEYALLNSQDYHVTMQSLIDCSTGACDAMEVADDKGAKRTFFFDVSRPMNWMTSKLGNKAKR